MRPVAAVAALALLAAGAGAQPTLRVPARPPVPVLIDGRFAPGEWDDAARAAVGPLDTLLVKEHAGHLYLGVVTARAHPVYVDLFVRDGGGALHNLHASMQLGERRLAAGDTTWTDARPATRWGNEVDWTANESKLRPDRPRAPGAPLDTSHLFPQRGREFQIRRARFPGARWRVRVELRDLAGREPDLVVPAGSTRRDPDGWLTLALP
ncbi:hypothetical protein [Roseisolibacter sp. H3M3-2]|uniref:hypothetical protein n=1 Tax=Roseisolibacter sp. H3M3-2 TaxID=3031323 RepID=UPI0023DB264C|nr:hypothetical protein [Roseisolibacter sp. H3M3-2]MDF1502230.1 hypothetical protein [Roseisolibacter sp. H3M3-2]